MQSTGKAVKRVKSVLPRSPRKKVHVLKSLLNEFGADVTISETETRGRNKLATSITEKVIAFYSSDEISRMAPGKKDCIKVGGEMVQKRHLYNNITESYELFKLDNPDDIIGRSKFASLRPKNVLPMNEIPHTVCVCPIHENMRFLIDVLTKNSIGSSPTTGRELIEACVCNRGSSICMKVSGSECVTCKHPTSLYSFENVDIEVEWSSWIMVEGRSINSKQRGTITEVMDKLKVLWTAYLNHCFYKDNQSAHFEERRKNLGVHDCVMQLDFSENYQTSYQDEVQSAHFTYKQVTIFTCCVWTKTGHQSYCIVSDYLSHDKYAVHTFLDRIISDARKRFPGVETFHVFSDGASGQFKQRFMLSNLNHYKSAHDLKHLEWNFFASSHGKGAVDGIGGTVKRLVWRLVKSRKESVANAEQFFEVAKRNSSSAVLKVMTQDVEKNKAFLDQRWQSVRPIPSLQKVHHIVAAGNNAIRYATVARMHTKLHSFNMVARRRFDTTDNIIDNI